MSTIHFLARESCLTFWRNLLITLLTAAISAFPAPSDFKMSSDIAWAVTRNNSAFLLKKRGCPKPFSTDPLNLTNKNSQRYNGYLNKKAVGIQAMDKGFAVSVKKPSRANRPGRNIQGRYSVLS